MIIETIRVKNEMYSPVKDGIEKSVVGVYREEPRPSSKLVGLVDCFWELKSLFPLDRDFILHVVPDACVNILFNELNRNIAGVTAIGTSHITLNLGREFHYVGIQLLPGAWQGNLENISRDFVGEAYTGELPLVQVNLKMTDLAFSEKQVILEEFVEELVEMRLVQQNPVLNKLLGNLSKIHSVATMAEIAGLSTRQLQRNLKQWTGFSPHDFLKVMRLQQAIKDDFPVLFADQSHYIHSFQSMTGYPPGKFFKKFNV